MCLNNLGSLFQDQGEFEKAKKYHEESLSIRRTMLEENHPDIAMSLNNLGLLFQDQNEFEIAKKISRRSLSIRRTVLGENHPDTALV